jgi:hypothetical protein
MNTHPLPYEDFEDLTAVQCQNSVSLYLPMDLKGLEQNKHLAQNKLKQCLRDAGEQLAENGMTPGEITAYLEPAGALLTMVELWRNPASGLVIFLCPEDEMRYYRIPIAFDLQVYAGENFYLSPLLPLYHNDGQYYLLELSQDYVRLYSASRFGFTDMDLKEVAPQQLEEAVGFDHKQKSLQWHTGQSGKGANFHGHGAGKDDEQKEVISFLRKVDAGVNKKIEGQHAPLVLSCVDDLVPLYRKANSYNSLFTGHVSGDPEYKNDQQRHQESWDVVCPFFEQHKNGKISAYQEQQYSEKCSSDPRTIIPAAINGWVDTLFLAEGISIFGTFDRERNEVKLDEGRNAENSHLSDLAAIRTFMQGGKVYSLSSEAMPETQTAMNAVFRY